MKLPPPPSKQMRKKEWGGDAERKRKLKWRLNETHCQNTERGIGKKHRGEASAAQESWSHLEEGRWMTGAKWNTTPSNKKEPASGRPVTWIVGDVLGVDCLAFEPCSFKLSPQESIIFPLNKQKYTKKRICQLSRPGSKSSAAWSKLHLTVLIIF